ncbi:MAG: thioredoxin reductase [Actinobacteria bacterium]|nr:MAG: thioredoxin reductase [Actinomycetota bacterium]REK41096.1 MAG: thioredoxin reductase [Actinomycetota bacterium]
MASVAIVGDGPGGLSAALFLAKNKQRVTVYGQNETAMHFAFLYNYLGIPAISGSDFQEIARKQVEEFGAEFRMEQVTAVSVANRFSISTDSGSFNSDYLILSEGKNPELARSLDLKQSLDGVIEVDRQFRSSREGVYVIGRSARPHRSQAIISAGAGATAALDILAREEGKDFQDWDTPPK